MATPASIRREAESIPAVPSHPPHIAALVDRLDSLNRVGPVEVTDFPSGGWCIDFHLYALPPLEQREEDNATWMWSMGASVSGPHRAMMERIRHVRLTRGAGYKSALVVKPVGGGAGRYNQNVDADGARGSDSGSSRHTLSYKNRLTAYTLRLPPLPARNIDAAEPPRPADGPLFRPAQIEQWLHRVLGERQFGVPYILDGHLDPMPPECPRSPLTPHVEHKSCLANPHAAIDLLDYLLGRYYAEFAVSFHSMIEFELSRADADGGVDE